MPILILVVAYTARDAVPLSNAMVVAVGLVNVVQIAPQRHPVADRPLIDYWLGMVMVPMMLSGTVFGVLLNTMFPNWLVLTLLVLGATRAGVPPVALTRRARQCWASRRGAPFASFARSGKRRAPPIGWPSAAPSRRASWTTSCPTTTCGTRPPTAATTKATAPRSATPVAQSPARRPSCASCWPARRACRGWWSAPKCCVWRLSPCSRCSKAARAARRCVLRDARSALTVLQLAGVQPCSGAFWVLQFLPAPVLLIAAAIVGRHLMHKHQRKVALNYSFAPGDVIWSLHNVLLVSGASFVTGVIASLIGIGGGMVVSR